MGDAHLVDKNSYDYKMSHHEAGKGFFGGGKRLSKDGRGNYDEIFGEKKPWWEVRDEKKA